MGVTSGDIIEITYNHPTLGSGVLLPKSGEDSTFDPGGFRSEDDDSMMDGGGNMIDKLTQKRWFVQSTIAWDMNVREELDKLQALAANPELADWTVTHINGTVWGGKGKPVGEVQGNAAAGTIALKVAGGGKMKKILG